MSAVRHRLGTVVSGALLVVCCASTAEGQEQPIAPGPPLDVSQDLTPKPASGDPANAAFLDSTAGMVVIDQRWESEFAVALRVGFHADRFSFAAKLGGNIDATYAAELPEGYAADSGYVADPEMFLQLSAGYAAWVSRGFVLTPALAVMRTDNPAYGTAVGLEMPFVWVSRGRMRIGFEAGIWGAFGGYNSAFCDDPETGCPLGQRTELSRDPGWGFTSAFVIGLELGGPY